MSTNTDLKALVEFLRYVGKHQMCYDCVYAGECDSEKCLFNASADVMEELSKERKAGKWIHDTLGKVKMPIVKCSECGLKEVWHEEDGMGFALHGQKYANFCPNCGAKMEG